jgi:hypothetical protein
MNDFNPLEVELRSLAPRGPSFAFKQSVLKKLRVQPESMPRSWPVWAAAALAAACLAALVVWSNGPMDRFQRNDRSQPNERLAIEPLEPTVLAYRRVLNRAPQELNALLDRQNAFTLIPMPPGTSTRAFPRSDTELYR